MIGVPPDDKMIFLIDFGLASYVIDEHGKHIENKAGQPMVGTARFTPICSHLGFQQNRASDLESLGYLAVYFLKGELPWMNLDAKTKEEKFHIIGQKKINIPVEALCSNLPREFESYFNYIQNLAFDSEPSYSFIRKIFRTLFLSKKLEYDCRFDWELEQASQLTFKTEMVFYCFYIMGQLQNNKSHSHAITPIVEQNSSEEKGGQTNKVNGMKGSKEDSRKSSSAHAPRNQKDAWGKSVTSIQGKSASTSPNPHNHKKRETSIPQMIENQQQLLQVMHVQNTLLSRQSDDEDQENVKFEDCNEYFPYMLLSKKMQKLNEFSFQIYIKRAS